MFSGGEMKILAFLQLVEWGTFSPPPISAGRDRMREGGV